jgi:hypothetical protein
LDLPKQKSTLLMSVSFPFYHWFFTLLISPVFSFAFDKLFGKSPHQVIGLLEAYPVTLLFSCFFSFPTLIVYLFVFYFLAKNDVRAPLAKTILMLVTLFGVIITMLISFDKEGSILWNYLASYALGCIVVGVILPFPNRSKVFGKYA